MLLLPPAPSDSPCDFRQAFTAGGGGVRCGLENPVAVLLIFELRNPERGHSLSRPFPQKANLGLPFVFRTLQDASFLALVLPVLRHRMDWLQPEVAKCAEELIRASRFFSVASALFAGPFSWRSLFLQPFPSGF